MGRHSCVITLFPDAARGPEKRHIIMNFLQKLFFGAKHPGAPDGASIPAAARKAMAKNDSAFLLIFHDYCKRLLTEDRAAPSPSRSESAACGRSRKSLARLKTRGRV